jgi:hypothetical protein
MSAFNSLAESLATARARGRQDVLDIVHAALPASDAAEIESRVRQLSTVGEPPAAGQRALTGGTADGSPTAEGLRSTRALTGAGSTR